MGDWFRKTSWTAEDAVDFEKRLARARSRSRPQYIRVQSFHLLQTGQLDLIRVAAELARRGIKEYPSSLDVSVTHQVYGRCLEILGDTENALEQFRLSVNAEASFRAAQTDAYLDFCWIVARRRLESRYSQALDFLARFKDRTVFPIQRYKFHGALALILIEQGKRLAAQESAQKALVAAGDKQSPFRHHPRLGLVEHFDDDAYPRLRALVS